MPKKLQELLSNCKKSINKQWSHELINKYRKQALDIVQEKLELGISSEYQELLQLLRGLENSSSFRELPLDYPHSPLAYHAHKVYIPVEFIERMSVQLPPPMVNNNFENWLKLFENYYIVAGHDATLKCRYLIHCIGCGDKILNALSETIDKISYDKLLAKCRELFVTKDSQKEALLFLGLKQEQETVTQFALRIKEKAKQAGFSDEKLIITQFIKGIASTVVRFEVAKESATGKKFDELMVTAQIMENCEQQAGAASETHINKVKSDFKKNNNSNNKQKKKDYKNSDKKEGERKFTKKECFFCKKAGHFKKDCFRYKKWLEKKQKKVNEVTDNIGSLHLHDEENY